MSHHHKPRRPRGRPASPSEKEIMGFTLDSDLKSFIEQQAIRAGFIHQRSGKGNISAWLNSQLRKMQAEADHNEFRQAS